MGPNAPGQAAPCSSLPAQPETVGETKAGGIRVRRTGLARTIGLSAAPGQGDQAGVQETTDDQTHVLPMKGRRLVFRR
jgi:hypothetical protein